MMLGHHTESASFSRELLGDRALTSALEKLRDDDARERKRFK
jgi:hypothetical protein